MDDNTHTDQLSIEEKLFIRKNQMPMSIDKTAQLDTPHPGLMLSPYWLLLLMAVSVFASETFVMYILAWLPQLPMAIEAIVDASLLLIILSPTIYLFHFRPLSSHLQQQKKMIGQLAVSEERFNLALSAANDGLWDWNISNGNSYFSPQCSNLLGWEPDNIQLKSNRWKTLIHPADQYNVENMLKRHKNSVDKSFECEFRVKSKKRRWQWILARGKIVARNENGEPARMIGTMSDIHLRKTSQEKLIQSEKNIRYLSWQLMRNSETEKSQLARDLHDEFGQLLTAFQLGLETEQNHISVNKEKPEEDSYRLLSIVKKMSQNIHRICGNLSPVMLEDLGLGATLQSLIKEYQEHTDSINFIVLIEPAYEKLPLKIELVFYRICQEAISNAVKHANASSICVELSNAPEHVTLTVKDNGVGFDPKNIKHELKEPWGIGLLGMHERAAAINAVINIDSCPGNGTIVAFQYPRQQKASRL
ncbi:sensor histidine kinase [Thalassotalea sp. ND16A]|uniref:sensor histidine kinase n=1 Tax=Thalassotalea sp. ND16A TaxID=1535422 RepID=UPI00051D2AEC|nr:PAS domain-containing protein [Thalassotalea sp. ND16A]KGJ91579.1 putative signal transduction histidine kinase [Thalassotalea sp. ND16A]